MDRGFLQISFAWLFGIIAGAVILALAIFFATKVVNTGQYQSSAEIQKEIGVLLNPLETSFQSGQVTTMNIAAPTRINITCDNATGNFGREIIRTSQQSFGKWSVQTPGTAVQDKYIFTDGIPEGKNFFLFSKPLNLPFKVADLIYLTSDSQNYCFVNATSSIAEELNNLKESNIEVPANGVAGCTPGSTEVCFLDPSIIGSCSSAPIVVDYSGGYVQKNSGNFQFSGDALMYAAIFSDKATYDCQLQRLMKRENQLAKIYASKLGMIESYGCNSGMASGLISLEGASSNSLTVSDPGAALVSIASVSDTLSGENEVAGCRLW